MAGLTERMFVEDLPNPNKKIIHVQCSMCTKTFKFSVGAADLQKFEDGEFVQRAFPYLTPDERELFVTGMCGACFDDFLGPEVD